MRESQAPSPRAEPRASAEPAAATVRKKLSYLEAREFAGIEEKIEAADQRVRTAQSSIDDPAVASDAAALTAALDELNQAQQEADALYLRWAELTEKTG